MVGVVSNLSSKQSVLIDSVGEGGGELTHPGEEAFEVSGDDGLTLPIFSSDSTATLVSLSICEQKMKGHISI